MKAAIDKHCQLVFNPLSHPQPVEFVCTVQGSSIWCPMSFDSSSSCGLSDVAVSTRTLQHVVSVPSAVIVLILKS